MYICMRLPFLIKSYMSLEHPSTDFLTDIGTCVDVLKQPFSNICVVFLLILQFHQ